MTDQGRVIVKHYKKLVQSRSPFEQYWRSAFEYSYPLRGQQFEGMASTDAVAIQSNSSQDKSKLYDSTGKDALRLLASSMLSGLTPGNMQWFTWQFPNPTQKGARVAIADGSEKEATEWLQNASRVVFRMIHSSNYDAEAFEFMLDLAIGGMCGLYVELDENNQFKFEFWPLATMYVADTRGLGTIDTVYRCVPMTATQVAEKFGQSALTESMKEEYASGECVKRHPIIHCIKPRMKGKKQSYGKLNKTLPWESTWVCEKSGKLLLESGYHEMPVIVPRWNKIPNSDYAVGPYDDVLPDVKSLNHLVKMMLTNVDMKVYGMMIIKDDGVINPNTAVLGARRYIVAGDTNSVKPFTPGGDFNIAVAEYQRMERNIRRGLMADQLQPQADGPALTATEVQVRLNLIRQLLGPVYGRLSAEFLQPLLDRCFGLALRAGLFGEVPRSLAGRDFYPEYSSPLARAQKQEDIVAMDQFEGALIGAANARPEVLDLYDFDGAARYRAMLNGVPEKLLKDERAVKRIREDRAARQQAQQEMALAAEGQ